MYATLLALHSVMRWLVLISLLFAVYRACSGWLTNKPFTKFDNTVRHATATIAHVQLTIGVWLYIISPAVQYFIYHFRDALSQREYRFFGMEHIFMMVLAVTLLTVGSAIAKRKATDHEKFKTMAVWYSITLFVIFISIPWSFSPVSPHRPYFRGF